MKIRIHVYKLKVKWLVKEIKVVIGILFVLLLNVPHIPQLVSVIKIKKRIFLVFGLDHLVENLNVQMLQKLILLMKIVKNSYLIVSQL